MTGVDYEEIFHKAEVGIALNDPETGTVGVVNDYYAELLGYTQDELRSMQIEEISADDPTFDQDAALTKMNHALTGTREQFDWLFERKNDTQFWGEVVLKRTQIGSNDRLLAFIRDITERKQYERELEQQNQRLNEFTDIVSHDLRSPLTVATGRLALAKRDCDTPHLDPLGTALTRMENLIDNLLTLAHSGETIGELETVSLADLARECWQHVETGPVDLVIESNATIKADPQRLQQVIENLVRNTVAHAADADTITIGDLETGFYYEDDGSGIPPGERNRVFESGYTTAEAGTGFGLSIVREIADAHGWGIDVTEGSEGGARFEMRNVERVKDQSTTN